MAINPSLSNVLDRVNLVVFQTRIVTPIRDTGEGKKEGSRIEKVLQSCFDPTVLRPLNSKKQEATRICRAYGTKVETLNAWAVPVERTQELIDQLSRIAGEWNGLAEDLARNIGLRVEAWARQNPSESATIRELAPSAQEVRDATRFIFTSYRLRAEDVNDNGCLESDLSGLSGQTLHEFAVALRDASLDKASGDQYTQAVKDVLGRIARKAESLAFLDQRIAEVASVLTSTIAVLPTNGLISDAHAILVKSVVDQMLDPRKLMRSGFRKVELPARPAQAVSAMPAQPAVPQQRESKKAPAKTPAAKGAEKAPVRQSVPPAMPAQAFAW